MVKKWVKRSILILAVVMIIGTILFGNDVVSYAKSSLKFTQETAKESIPIEFELRRAKDLLEEIIPEIHANVQMIATEEVEIATLKKEMEDSAKSVADEKARVSKLRSELAKNQESYTFGNKVYTRGEVTEELAWRFERLKEAEMVLESKKRLMGARENSLKSATELLEKTRSQKRLLASKIEGLESQHRLVKATAIGSGIKIDNSKLAQTEKLIGDIKKRLDVAERVLSHESKFVQNTDIDIVEEKDLVEKVDEYFAQRTETALTVQ